MLDIKWVKANEESVRQAIKDKHLSLDITQLLERYETFLELQRKEQDLLTQRKAQAKKIPKASDEERQSLVEEGRHIGQQIDDLKPLINQAKDAYTELLYLLPNIPSKSAPRGKSEEDNVVVKTHGLKTQFAFRPLDHVDLLEKNNWSDFHRIGEVCGGRSYCLKGEMVQLEYALLNFAMNHLSSKGFQLISMPSMVREFPLVGTGHFPEGRDQVYYIESDNIYLSGTAEVQANALHHNEILDEKQLPIKYAAISPCYRREAGSYGKDVRGLIRVHQFVKVEQYVICKNDLEESERIHRELLQNSEEILQKLEIPYQVVECCTGDMGLGKYQMFDIESWVPSEEKYRETHSCSNLLDWQARRTNLRYRDKDGKIHYCHTLNNTALASPRILVPFMENHQTQEGRIKIPDALQTYIGNKAEI